MGADRGTGLGDGSEARWKIDSVSLATVLLSGTIHSEVC